MITYKEHYYNEKKQNLYSKLRFFMILNFIFNY